MMRATFSSTDAASSSKDVIVTNFQEGTNVTISNWKWPNIPGLHSFKGELIHSAAWKEDYDLKDKEVAVLGVGSSGVQIIPTIQPSKCITRHCLPL